VPADDCLELRSRWLASGKTGHGRDRKHAARAERQETKVSLTLDPPHLCLMAQQFSWP
jgi:hypothetical protein